jgi:hypothetical protein
MPWVSPLFIGHAICVVSSWDHGLNFSSIATSPFHLGPPTLTPTARAHTHIHTRAHTCARTHAHAHTWAHTHARAHICTRTHMSAHTCTRTHMHTHTHTRAHTCAHIHTRARTHTHTHYIFSLVFLCHVSIKWGPPWQTTKPVLVLVAQNPPV